MKTNFIDSIHLGDSVNVLDYLIENDVKVNLTVTSPPYDDLRSYGKTCEWNFETFKEIANKLYKITEDGGILVWIVGDATIKGYESLSSFKQAIYFDSIGFKMHDTMIYEKNSSSFPARRDSKRYTQIFEYMFVFVKGKIRNDIKLLADKPNKWAGHTNWGSNTQYDKDGNLKQTNNIKPVPEFSLRNNIWKYSVGFNDKTGHPAVFPEKLAEDHILSWSNEGDIVLDPFSGSGTTGKMAMLNKRYFIGIEKNKEYFDKSIERLNKYELKINVYVHE
jgi:site-specific DNA-methyltransferase (adenine-specific)